ncbi:MAG TPA: TolC family protein [Myxococcota bacterium]|jgi:outer membrane protein TolC
MWALALAFALAAAGDDAHADADADDDAALSPDAAVKIALERSGAVRAVVLSGEENALKRNLTVPEPTVRVGHQSIDGFFTSPHTDGNGNPYAPLDDTYVSTTIRTPKPKDVFDQLGNGDAEKADALDVEDARQQLASDVRTLHAQLLALREESKLAASALDILTRLEAQTGVRLNAQATTALDARLATLTRIDAAADVEDIRAQVVRIDHKLAALLGRPAPLNLASPSKPLCQAPRGDLASVLARANERSPSLLALAAQKRRASIEAAVSWTAYLPYLDEVGLGYFNQPLDKRDSVRLFLDFEIPLFEPITGRSREAAIEERRLDALTTDASRQLEADVRSAYDRLNGALALVQLYDTSKQSIQEALNDVQQALEAGQADAFRVAEVQARSVAAERSALHARSHCEAAAIELARLTGDLVP